MLTALKGFIPKLKEAILAAYGKRLVSLVLYGSAGRQTANYESDIDILIVAEDLPKGRTRRVQEFLKVEENLKDELNKLYKKGIYTSLSPIIKTKKEVLFGSPLFLDMVEDSIFLYDRKNFFKNYLKKFKEKLKSLGAKRINLGSYWYWDLKSNYKPGENFEL